MIIADATAVIALAKMRRLELLRDLYGRVGIGPTVKTETVDRGKAISARGVEQIEQALLDGWLRVLELTSKERQSTKRVVQATRLDRGEIESLALAESRECMAILDDKEARAVAAGMGVKYLGTAAVLLEAYLREKMSWEDLEQSIRDLNKVLWLSPAVVAEILRRAREART